MVLNGRVSTCGDLVNQSPSQINPTKGPVVFNSYQKIQRRRSTEVDEKGFTLIELLIVIVVLGILAAVVVFALGGVTSQSAVSACNADAKTVSVAVSAEQAQTPTIAPSLATLVSGGYLKDVPKNPAYYTIGIGAAPAYDVTVTLNGTNGNTAVKGAWTGTPPAGAVVKTIAYDYEGTNSFVFDSVAPVPTADFGANICAGV